MNMSLLVSMFLSVVIVIITVIQATVKSIKHKDNDFSVLPFAIGGVFIAIVALFLPLHFYEVTYDFPNFTDNNTVIRCLSALIGGTHSAIRLFVVDCDFGIVIDTAEKLSGMPFLKGFYTIYSLLLYITAPILTFSAVLALLHNAIDTLKYQLCRNKPVFIMSELNDRSIALAESIRSIALTESTSDKFKKSVIVFANVNSTHQKISETLIEKAKELNAICLKKSVTQVNISSKKAGTEVFLIDDDESENVKNAVLITNKLNSSATNNNIKLFVFSVRKSSAYTLNSMKYDNLLSYKANSSIDNCFDYNDFKLRRVDYVKQLAWNTVKSMDLLKKAVNGVISISIIGMGAYGLEFFKTLIWFCQIEGYRLELNLFDTLNADRLKSRLHRQCPELIDSLERHSPGDCEYSIKLFGDIDFTSDDFSDILKKNSDRLESTSVLIVALGDDDLNIDVAIYLRRLFDRVLKVKAETDIQEENDLPAIYSIVYDETRSGNLSGTCGSSLITSKEIPYHIHFIGSIKQQFSYDNIYQYDLEKKAYNYHIEWSRINQKAANEMRKLGYSKEDIDHAGFSYGISNPQDEAKKYERFEYYRNASIAKAMHKKFLLDNGLLPVCTVKTNDADQLCDCANCEKRKRMEHKRWNAYMRADGYINDGTAGAERAKIHNDICDWELLSKWERAKD